MAPGVELGHALLHGDGAAQALQRLVERRHHGIADGLDDGAVMLADDRRQIGEVRADQPVGGGVAHRLVHAPCCP